MKKVLLILTAVSGMLMFSSCSKKVTCKCVVDMGSYGKSETTVEVEGSDCSDGNTTTTTTVAGITVTANTTCTKL